MKNVYIVVNGYLPDIDNVGIMACFDSLEKAEQYIGKVAATVHYIEDEHGNKFGRMDYDELGKDIFVLRKPLMHDGEA